MTTEKGIKEAVNQHYAEAAKRSRQGAASCCAPDCCAPADEATITGVGLYAPEELKELPAEAVRASLGCGNPVARAEPREGEVVLDLGSGGGIDVILSAKKVGASGKAYGLDMTEEMLALARENARRAAVSNAEFLKGEMEDIPLPESSVDAIISNCVVNLSPDKDQVFREAYRVLRPGGRIAIADIVARGPIPPALKRSVELWTGCVAGALEETEYRRKLTTAGFADVDIEVTQEYAAEDLTGTAASDIMQGFGGLVSALVRGRKPGQP